MAELTIRAAGPGDVAVIGAIAAAAGQEDDWSGRNPAYVRHLLRHGRVLVAVVGEPGPGAQVAGFGATQLIGSGVAAVTMLCDLFVHPAAHGRGVGRALLAALWEPAPGRPGPRRMTFSSMHPNALPLYTSFGLDAWWPLLSLAGDGRALSAPSGWAVSAAAAGAVSELERGWTGTDRSADHRAWAGRPNGSGLLVSRNGAPVAAGTAAGPEGEYALVHLAISPAAGDEAAVAAVVTALAGLRPPGPVTTVCLPGPHPAVRPLLASGWKVTGVDQFMASEPGLLDPRRAVPSPGQA